MLTQFSVKNYKSIKDRITLDMQAAAISEHEDQVISANNQKYLPITAIYGPNGGGKTNVLMALYTLVTKVMSPIRAASDINTNSSKKTQVTPFAFDPSCVNQPTEFEVFFQTGQAEYRYILEIFHEQVVYESLDRIKNETGRRSALFRKDRDDVMMKGEFGKLKVTGMVSPTLPLLSYLGIAYRKNAIVDDVISWFENGIRFLNYGNPIYELVTVLNLDNVRRSLMLDMIKEMDLDIEDYRVDQIDEQRIEVYTSHNIDGNTVELSLNDESSGTKKLFALLPFIADSLIRGTTLIIDELDAKIHPVLLEYLITLFSNMKKNKKGAQLIFTSHDLSTMNSEVFRRDEIWFVAKGKKQNSNLYSLVEFKTTSGESVRKDAKFDKQYLEGRYGADPYLKKIINWESLNAE